MKRSVTSLLLLACFLMASACSQSPQRLLDAANRYHDKKKYPEASILYRKAIAKDKTFAEAYYREGLNLLDQNNPVEASKFLRRAVDLNPNNADAEIKLAEIYLTAYALDPQKFKNLLPEIKDLTGKILKRDPHDFHGIRLQAFIYLADKNMPKAIETFQVANQLRPHSRELVGWLAQTLVADQQFGEAEKLMRDMIAHDKTWGPAYDLLFVQYSKQNKTPAAEQILKDRITNDTQNSLSYINYSNFLLAHQRYPEAEQTMKKLLDDPKACGSPDRLLTGF